MKEETIPAIFTSFQTVVPIEIIPGFRARFIHTQNQTFSLVEIDKGAVLPDHSHIHEQFSKVVKGSFQLTVNGQTKECNEGDIALIPSEAPHSGKAITNCVIMDVFTPAREDYRKLSISPEERS